MVNHLFAHGDNDRILLPLSPSNAMNPPSFLSRSLAPLAGVFWALYLVTSALVAIVWISGFGEGTLAEPAFKRAIPNPELRSSLVLFSRGIDSAWMALGAVAVYLGLARNEGLSLARRWAVVIMITGFALTLLSAKTRWPLGPVHYPENFGWKIGSVPFGIPLLWFVIIAGSREVTMRLSSRAGHLAVSLGTAIFSLITISNVDPVAWRYRAWWLWYPKPFEGTNHAPIQSYATWFAAALLLAWLMRSVRVASEGGKRSWAPVIVWSVLNAIALLTPFALRVR
jgi:uncharacterized membrane protein